MVIRRDYFHMSRLHTLVSDDINTRFSLSAALTSADEDVIERPKTALNMIK
jgi:hypothetical protein